LGGWTARQDQRDGLGCAAPPRGEAGLDELAAATGCRARDLKRRQLSTLIERNLVVEKREGLYMLHPDFGWQLEFERALFSDEKRTRRNVTASATKSRANASRRSGTESARELEA